MASLDINSAWRNSLPVWGNNTQAVDITLVAATATPLYDAVKAAATALGISVGSPKMYYVLGDTAVTDVFIGGSTAGSQLYPIPHLAAQDAKPLIIIPDGENGSPTLISAAGGVVHILAWC